MSGQLMQRDTCVHMVALQVPKVGHFLITCHIAANIYATGYLVAPPKPERQ